MHVVFPIRIESTQNKREHWSKKASRNKLHRISAWAALRQADNAPRLLGPIVVTITRIAPRLLDDDNNVSGCKATRDGIADYFGVDDRSPLIKWKYGQKRGLPKEYACEIVVQTEEEALRMVEL